MPKSDGDSDYQPDSEDFSDEEDIGSPSTLTTQEITDILLENNQMNKNTLKCLYLPSLLADQGQERERVDKKKAVQDVMREKREMGPTCNAPLCKKWRNRLCDTVKQEERQQLYDEFWKNMTWESKKTFVCATVDILQVEKRTKKKPHSNKERSRSFAYFLRVNGERIPVCKNMYLSSLGLRENEVRYWIESFIENNQPSMRRKASSVAAEEMQEPDEEDQRQEAEEKEQGQEVDEDEQERDIQLEPTPNPRRRLPERRSFVEAFFAKLPTLPSHYCRKNSKKLYIQTNLTSWSLLYQMYKQTCQENDEMEPLSRYYFDHIRKKRNLGIYAPNKDRCDLCCSFELGNASPEVFEAHQKNKNLAREEKEHDKEAAIRGECHTIVLDLMEVQTCPWIRASSAYFKLKLVVHNYTVYNLSNHDSKLYWFDETQASLSASTDYSKNVAYTSIRPGKVAGDPTVVDLRALKYTPEGKIYFKLNFDEDYQEMPRRSKRTSFNPVEEFPPLFATRPKIPEDKFMNLQSLKPLLPSDTYAFYDSIPHQEESQRQVKRQKVAETKKKQ
ncbi:hypothetical protein GE061_014808 [Apolygus lucorum]|uniref:Uncharacterized protein n=1 Tax=Apolygus lucorum TaxID=248454 RepID=A0A8S9XNB0_APOLU|nr:hypothetical protein GE061_014808 [Apolygus lucorum]